MEEDGITIWADDTTIVIVIAIGYLADNRPLRCVYQIDTMMSTAYLGKTECFPIRTPRESFHIGAERTLDTCPTLGGTLNHNVSHFVFFVDISDLRSIG